MSTTFAYISTQKELQSSLVLKKKKKSWELEGSICMSLELAHLYTPSFQILGKLIWPLVSCGFNFSNTAES